VLKLAELNLKYIKESGAKTIVTTCPECLRTLTLDFPEHLEKLDVEILHISQFIQKLVDEGKLEFNENVEDLLKITYHDPCRLGRQMGVYEAPRKVIESTGKSELIEMDRNRETSVCCGVSAWTNCKSHSKQMQIERIMEAKSTGADVLMTACPKCNIHLKCSVHNEIPVDRDKVDIEILDFTEIIARALGLGGEKNGG
jgi:Fe-S oxidoreductase